MPSNHAMWDRSPCLRTQWGRPASGGGTPHVFMRWVRPVLFPKPHCLVSLNSSLPKVLPESRGPLKATGGYSEQTLCQAPALPPGPSNSLRPAPTSQIDLCCNKEIILPLGWCGIWVLQVDWILTDSHYPILFWLPFPSLLLWIGDPCVGRKPQLLRRSWSTATIPSGSPAMHMRKVAHSQLLLLSFLHVPCSHYFRWATPQLVFQANYSAV